MAGGGTGSFTLFLAESLNHTNAEVMYLDFSMASMKIAQRRAIIRHVSNVIWINGWIENLPQMGLSLFHFVTSTGVLHHLKDTPKGLAILKDNLLSIGGMSLLLYGAVGRTAIYQMQKLLGLANKDSHNNNQNLSNDIERAKRLLE